jgi:ligand-binding sensor domain-containing protein
VLWSALLWFFASPVPAVDPSRYISQYAHNAWTIQDGYLAGAARSIGQTTDGYLWIGTGGDCCASMAFVSFPGPHQESLHNRIRRARLQLS